VRRGEALRRRPAQAWKIEDELQEESFNPSASIRNVGGRAGKVQEADQNLWKEVQGKDGCLGKFMKEKESSQSLSGQPTRPTNSIVRFAQVAVANKTFD
jgi:hypothetical protein